MFRRHHWLLTIKNESEVDAIMKNAANHNLTCLYKIGVYGKIRQHELFIYGTLWDYHRFIKTIKSDEE